MFVRLLAIEVFEAPANRNIPAACGAPNPGYRSCHGPDRVGQYPDKEVG